MIPALQLDYLFKLCISLAGAQELLRLHQAIFLADQGKELTGKKQGLLLEVHWPVPVLPEHLEHIPCFQRRPHTVADGLPAVSERYFYAHAQAPADILELAAQIKSPPPAGDLGTGPDWDVNHDMRRADRVFLGEDAGKQF